jgi:2-keto-4-pentenoate hydratase/2-oxohepta-3-ene-1,7-dioic acid hydratase in catechol pathway
MLLARFLADDGRAYTGQLLPDGTAAPLEGDLFGRHAFAPAGLPIARLLPPVQPPNIFAIGRNYGAHVRETGAKAPERPLIFAKPTSAVIGPGDEIVLPASAPDEVDFEAELAVIIGRPARRVSPAQALDFVLGYTCANDVSARDCQRDDKQWTRAKGFDTFCPLGPCLATADALDPERCVVRSRLNGSLMQEASTAEMTYSCRDLVSYLSHQFTLLPGTVILTGTPAGVGFARQPPIFLRPGDRIEVEIDGLGTLANFVRAAEPESC